jgi:hypothetical protein
MKVNFIGSFTTGYVGEVSDESHLAYEIEALGHAVRRVSRDQWRETVIDGKTHPSFTSDFKADFNIIAKWDGFYDGSFVNQLRVLSGAPVFYWVWDWMQKEPWHMEMVKASDLYLGNDVRSGAYKDFSNCYYFPFDVSNRHFDKVEADKIRNVAFFGSWIPQGNRQKYLQEINASIPISIFSWNYKDWPLEFKDTHPAVYGNYFAKEIAQTKICLGFSVHPHTWGYWSNRVGKILTTGGFLLYEYAPGMELFLRDGADYFSSPDEAIDKIRYYLLHEDEMVKIAQRGYQIGRERFTSKERIKDLLILAERYVKKGDAVWKI